MSQNLVPSALQDILEELIGQVPVRRQENTNPAFLHPQELYQLTLLSSTQEPIL